MKDKFEYMSPHNIKVACHLKERCVFLCGPINPITQLSIKQAFNKLLKLNSKKPIRFVISSKGGDFYAGIKIFQYLTNLSVNIETVVPDLAFSAAFIISQAGKIRSASESARFCFHLANVRLDNIRYNSKTLKDSAAILDRIDATQFLILTLRGRPPKSIFQLLDEEAEISAEKALELNLIDRILPKSKIPKIVFDSKKPKRDEN